MSASTSCSSAWYLSINGKANWVDVQSEEAEQTPERIRMVLVIADPIDRAARLLVTATETVRVERACDHVGEFRCNFFVDSRIPPLEDDDPQSQGR